MTVRFRAPLTREETIGELQRITDFSAEVYVPVERRWAPGFAVRSEFPRPSAREIHAAELRRKGLTNEEISSVLRIERTRVTVLVWRGEGFLRSVEGDTQYEDERRADRRRL